MENQLHNLLHQNLNLTNENIKTPELSLVQSAREKVAQRKLNVNLATRDIFSLIARFLNLKIKLYHAVIISLIVGACIFFFSKEEKGNTNKAAYTPFEKSIASVRNNTVLSSINTCIGNK